MNTFDLAETFIVIADVGSIYKAAERLHQTNAAISKKLSKLEAHLGTPLIKRARDGLTLTSAGQQYYHEAKKAIIQFTLAEQSVLGEIHQPQGELRVVAKQFYIETIVLPKLPEFLNNYPYLDVHLDATEALPNFNAKKMDILFGCAEVCASGEGNIIRKKIATSTYILCASPTYLKRKGSPNSSAELLQYDFIAHGGRKIPELIILDKAEQILTKPKLTLNNTELIIQAALSHLGFIWIDQKLIANLIVKKKLICILEENTQEPVNIYLFYQQQQKLDPKVRAFIDFFIEES